LPSLAGARLRRLAPSKIAPGDFVEPPTTLRVVRGFSIRRACGQNENTRSGQRVCFILLARPEGFEPPTTWFEARYSIQLSYGRAGEGDSTCQVPPSH
jgi:hypothetical protein